MPEAVILTFRIELAGGFHTELVLILQLSTHNDDVFVGLLTFWLRRRRAISNFGVLDDFFGSKFRLFLGRSSGNGGSVGRNNADAPGLPGSADIGRKTRRVGYAR